MTTNAGLGKVAVALDGANREEFEAWCQFFGPRVGALKVGLEAFIGFGRSGLAVARSNARKLFLDLKLHDIPHTVEAATRAAAALDADLLTVHVAGGRRMLAAALEGAAGRVSLLGVTVLTHLDRQELAAVGLPNAEHLVESRAALAAECGLRGVVCSPREVGALRQQHPAPFRLVTPGIRWKYGARDDQRRVATPEAALAAGSDLLVVGRPLTRAQAPARALEDLARRIQEPAVE